MRSALLVLLFLALSATGYSTTYHVPGDFATIQAAVDACVHGDEVLVGPGTYFENVVIVRKHILVQSTDGPSVTVVDGSQPTNPDIGSCFHITNTYVGALTIDGFTVTNGTGSLNPGYNGRYGGGFFTTECAQGLLIRNCIVEGNSASFGGGIGNHFGHPAVEDCIIRNNTAHVSGGGISSHALTYIEIQRNLIDGNTSQNHGGGIYIFNDSWGEPTIASNLIRGNRAGGNHCGGGIYVTDIEDAYLFSNTIVENSAGDRGGALFTYMTGMKAIDNIFWNNSTQSGTGAEIGALGTGYGSWKIDRCIVKGGPSSCDFFQVNWLEWKTVHDVDPLFVNPQGLDYHLSRQSYAIDRGSNSPWSGPFDFEGNPRIIDGDRSGTARSDIGCDEFTHAAEVWVDDDWAGLALGDPVAGHVFGVTAFDLIQDALLAVGDPGTVHVADGIYRGSGNRDVEFHGIAATVKSGNGPGTCIIDCQGGGRAFYIHQGEGPDTVVDGFTIRNGYASDKGGGMFIDHASPTVKNCRFLNNVADLVGGGLHTEYSDSLVSDCLFEGNSAGSSAPCTGGGGMSNLFQFDVKVEHCVFRNNVAVASTGGGILNTSTRTEVRDCVFEGNQAGTHGGGIYCHGMVNGYEMTTLLNCTFHKNSAADAGGGMCVWNEAPNPVDTPLVVNCTFTENLASQPGGALYNHDSAPTVVNSILWSNSTAEVHNTGSLAEISHSCVQGGYQGTGNIDLDPLLADQVGGDLHLRSTSPCRDAGTTNATVFPTEDFEGDPRVAGSAPDMGADEHHTRLYHVGDAVAGSLIALKVVGTPAAPVTLFLGSKLLDPPYPTQHGDFCLKWPALWQGKVGVVPGDGIFILTVNVPVGWASGSVHPLQALVGAWGSSGTELTNPLLIVVE